MFGAQLCVSPTSNMGLVGIAAGWLCWEHPGANGFFKVMDKILKIGMLICKVRYYIYNYYYRGTPSLLFVEPSVHFPQKRIHSTASLEDIPEQSMVI